MWGGSIGNRKNWGGGGGGVWLRALTGGDGNLGDRGGVLGDMGGVLGDRGGMCRSVSIGGTRGERFNVILPDSQVFSSINALFLCPIATSTLTSALIWTAWLCRPTSSISSSSCLNWLYPRPWPVGEELETI